MAHVQDFFRKYHLRKRLSKENFLVCHYFKTGESKDSILLADRGNVTVRLILWVVTVCNVSTVGYLSTCSACHVCCQVAKDTCLRCECISV